VQEAITSCVWQLLRHWKDAGLLVASGATLAVCKAPPQVDIPGSKVAPGGTYSTYITKHDLGRVRKEVRAVIMWMKRHQGVAASLAAVATVMVCAACAAAQLWCQGPEEAARAHRAAARGITPVATAWL
jgi:hypothetical protein